MHSLLHLADDYGRFGPLDNCSAFPFENYMKTLKGMLRKHERPLQQVVRRYEELCELPNAKLNECDKLKFSKEEPDCFVSLKNGKIVKIRSIHLNSGCIFGQIFKEQSEMFTIPLKSSRLGIFIVNDLSININQWEISDIDKKIMLLCIDRELTAFPLIR